MGRTHFTLLGPSSSRSGAPVNHDGYRTKGRWRSSRRKLRARMASPPPPTRSNRVFPILLSSQFLAINLLQSFVVGRTDSDDWSSGWRVLLVNLKKEGGGKVVNFETEGREKKKNLKMAASSSCLMACRILFTGLGCFMLATLVYTISTDGSPFRKELLTPWMIATLIDFYANVVAISVWVIYKETSWVNAAIWVILLICIGSVATCAYIVRKLLDISSQDLHDLVSRILLRSDYNLKMKGSYVVFLRILFTALGIFVLAVVAYTTITDGLPFRKELLTPWMAATLIDFYINVIAISVWVVHKESTWIGTLFWILLLICFGSIATSAYIVIQLCRLTSQEPMYRALLGSQSKHENNLPSK